MVKIEWYLAGILTLGVLSPAVLLPIAAAHDNHDKLPECCAHFCEHDFEQCLEPCKTEKDKDKAKGCFDSCYTKLAECSNGCQKG